MLFQSLTCALLPLSICSTLPKGGWGGLPAKIGSSSSCSTDGCCPSSVEVGASAGLFDSVSDVGGLLKWPNVQDFKPNLKWLH